MRKIIEFEGDKFSIDERMLKSIPDIEDFLRRYKKSPFQAIFGLMTKGAGFK